MSHPTPPVDRPAAAEHHESFLREWLPAVVPILLLAIVAFAVAWHFVQPAPPSHVVIATGPKSGAYYAIATKYVDFFKANGVTLDVRETEGSVENYKLLSQSDSGVDLAIVQAGSAPPAEQRAGIEAVASIYYEPILLFYRGDETLTRLPQLADRRIAIGAEGSGVRVMAKLLLDEAGITDESRLLPLGSEQAADALVAGQIDAAFFVISPDAPVVARLLAAPGVRLMSLDHARAYARRHPVLSPTTLFRGSVDVRRDLPSTDVSLAAAPTTLAIRNTTHRAIVQLLVRAAQDVNRDATLLSDPNEFPRAPGSELPLNGDARYFLQNPPNILHRTLPFWLASFVDRMIILVLPLLVVLIPLARLTPPLFRWRSERKLLSRYRRVRQIERDLTETSPRLALETGIAELQSMDSELATLKLPVAFSRDLYDLRNSLAYVRHRLDTWLRAKADETPSNA